MEKVVEIKNLLVMSNAVAMELVHQPITPLRESFDKLVTGSVVNGQLQYWVLQTWKKGVKIAKDADESRITLIRDCAEKNDKGELKFIDEQYQFDSDQKKVYEKDIATLVLEERTRANLDAIAEKYCMRDKEGNPIKAGGQIPAFTAEGMKNFNLRFEELRSQMNTLSFNQPKVTITLLNAMNQKALDLMKIDPKRAKDIIETDDIERLESAGLVEFTE
jgi:hypothetical protein